VSRAYPGDEAEVAVTRSALLELAHGSTPVTPAGTRRLDLVDLLHEFNRQLSR